MTFQSGIPDGPLKQKWDNFKASMKLVSPANKKKRRIIVVGTGLAGSSAAATLGELGYHVDVFTILDSARRAHSIAAQGGINATKNYPYDGDSVWRLFYDTIKGGDYRSREANTYRLAQLSANIIDQAVAQGVPFARDYGGDLDNRSFGGAQVSRTFYARGQTGQQLLLGAYSALMRQVDKKKSGGDGVPGVTLYNRKEMLDLVIVDGQAKGIIVRDLTTGEIERYAADAVLLASGGYGRAFFLSTNAFNSNATAIWRAHKRGAYFANPCYVQIHPTCIPSSGDYQSKLTLMSESLRNDGRVWVPKTTEDAKAIQEGRKHAKDISEEARDYYLERRYPSFGNLVPRDVASRNAKNVCDEGRGVNPTGRAVFLDFEREIKAQGRERISDKYGNLFEMYEKIAGEDPYKTPMMIYPAIHYSMGGLWVDYSLMSNIPGLFVLGEANFSDHGANRLGASALMQGLADGYFVIPHTLGNWLATENPDSVDTTHSAFAAAEDDTREYFQSIMDVAEKNKNNKDARTVIDIYRELGVLMYEDVGVSRTKEGLEHALEKIPKIRESFWNDLSLPLETKTFSKYIEIAGRTADFLELTELMARDALDREESAGGHFREEHQTGDGEAKRRDEEFSYVAAWEWKGSNQPHDLHKEELIFDNVQLTQRSYK